MIPHTAKPDPLDITLPMLMGNTVFMPFHVGGSIGTFAKLVAIAYEPGDVETLPGMSLDTITPCAGWSYGWAYGMRDDGALIRCPMGNVERKPYYPGSIGV
jgi:hypothetical protein